MEDVLNQRLEELPHNRYDIVSKHIFGTFTEDLLAMGFEWFNR